MDLWHPARTTQMIANLATSVWRQVKSVMIHVNLTEIEREEEKEMVVVVEANGVGPHLVGIIHEVEDLRMEEAAGATVAGQEGKAILGVALMKKHQQQHQS